MTEARRRGSPARPRLRRHPGVRQSAAALVGLRSSGRRSSFAVLYCAQRARHRQRQGPHRRTTSATWRRARASVRRRPPRRHRSTRRAARRWRSDPASARARASRRSPRTASPCHARRRRRRDRPEPDRRLLAPRRDARRDLQRPSRRRARQGHAGVGQDAASPSRSTAVAAYVIIAARHAPGQPEGAAGQCERRRAMTPRH